MANTRLEILKEVYLLIWEPSDSTGDFWAKRINSDINIYQDKIIKWNIKSEVDGTMYKAPDLRFMRKKSFITWHSPVKLTTKVETTDTTIYFDALNFESSGYLVIEWDVIQYTGKTDTTITGCSWIDTTHAVSKKVRQVYLVPATSWRVFGVELIGDTSWKNFLDEKDFRSDKDFNRYYTILGDLADTTSEFVDIHWYSNNDRFMIHYYEKATSMSLDASTTDLPDDYWKFVLAPLVAGSILYYTDEQALGIGLLKKAYSNLETFYSQYAEKNKPYRPHVKTTSINSFNSYTRYGNY